MWTPSTRRFRFLSWANCAPSRLLNSKIAYRPLGRYLHWPKLMDFSPSNLLKLPRRSSSPTEPGMFAQKSNAYSELWPASLSEELDNVCLELVFSSPPLLDWDAPLDPHAAATLVVLPPPLVWLTVSCLLCICMLPLFAAFSRSMRE